MTHTWQLEQKLGARHQIEIEFSVCFENVCMHVYTSGVWSSQCLLRSGFILTLHGWTGIQGLKIVFYVFWSPAFIEAQLHVLLLRFRIMVYLKPVWAFSLGYVVVVFRLYKCIHY